MQAWSLYAREQTRGNRSGASPYLLAPMGIIGLANALRQRGLDVIGINYPMEVALNQEFRLVPWLRQQDDVRLVMIDLHWYEHAYGAMDVMRACKHVWPDVPVLLGGLTVSRFAEEIMANFQAVDYVRPADSIRVTSATLALPRARAVPRRWQGRMWRRVRRYPIGFLGAAIVILVVALAISADLITPYDPVWQIDERLTPPNWDYVLGLDEFGRDVCSRIIYGARVSLYAGIVSVIFIALPVGSVLGVLAGYFRGWIDTLLSRVVDMIFAFPSLLLAITIVGVLGPSLTNTMIAIGIVYAPTFARIARGSTLGVTNLDYIMASRTIGAGSHRIILHHVLPNIAAPLIVQTTLALSTAILIEATLSFLGLGTQPPMPSWGTMLGTGRRYMELAPWVAIYPGVAIMIAVLGFNLAGDGLRDALDPRLREA